VSLILRAWTGVLAAVVMAFVCSPLTPALASGQRVERETTSVALSLPSRALSSAEAFLQRYCVACHTEQQRGRGVVPLAFETRQLSNVGAHAETWERVIRKVRAGLMPPAGMPQPTPEGREAIISWLEEEIDSAVRAVPNPGRTEPLHRLNRAEYRNVIRDLLDLEIDVDSLLPADDASYGFDNIAGVSKISPTLLERYLAAAQRISRAAIGVPPSSPSIDYFRVADDLAQDRRLPGLAFGTRGGTLIRYLFPMDALYEIRVDLARDLNEQVPIHAEPQHLEVSIDGERVQVFTLSGVDQTARGPQARSAQQERNRADEDWVVRVPVKAGTRDVQVAFVQRTAALAETPRLPFLRPYPAGVNIGETRTGAYLRSVEISGPYDPTGPGVSPSRQRIFTCQPKAVADEPGCARAILAGLTRRAYRRPVTDEDLDPLLEFYRAGRVHGGFEAGIERALRRLLVSPEFLLRVEIDPPRIAPGMPYRVADLELASRLSFFLWSSIPDEELLDLAERGQLQNPAVLDEQIRRMVADSRFGRFVENFAGQWLFLRNLPASVPVQANFPDFDDTLRQAFRRETELFFESVVREDRSALDLLQAEYTFLNERLARHYGIPHVKGSHFRRVQLGPDARRRGLLGHGSLLTVTSYPDRTSPVVRGKWILENLLGTPPPEPPPNVPELEPPSFAGEVLSIRERIAQHRANPVCASCHSMMDPLGLALENFDAVGRWRAIDESGAPVDASGTLPDGTAFDGADGLAKALLGSGAFVTTLTEKLLTYALGRGLEYYDAPAVRAIVRDAARDDYRFMSLVRGVIQSTPFQMRKAES
jgi:mono/diheme cytochrome c family protein